MGEKKLKKQEFSRSEKLDIIQEYLTTKLTSSDLARKYSIGSCNFVKTWMQSFNVEIKNSPLVDKNAFNFNLKQSLRIISKLRQKASTHIQYFTEEKKKEILKEYLSKNMSHLEVCRKYDIKWGTILSKWKQSFEKKLLNEHSQKGSLNESDKAFLDLIQVDKKLNKPRTFTQEFKNSIINEYETTNITKAELCRKYNLGSSTISTWILMHEANQKKIKKDKIISNNANLADKNKSLELCNTNINYVSDSLSQSIMMKLEYLNMSEKARLTLLTENKLLRSKLKELENNENKESLKSNKLDNLKATIRELEAENYKKSSRIRKRAFQKCML